MVGWCWRGRDVGLGLGVNGNSLVGDLSNVAIDVVSSVGDLLGTAVREGHGVRAAHNSVSIRGLGSLEVGLRVVVSNSVGVGVGLGSLLVDRLVVGGGGLGNSNSWVMHGVSNRVGNMGHRVSNRVGNMGHRVSNSVSQRVGEDWDSTVGSMSPMGNHGSVAVANHVGGDGGAGGSSSKASQGSKHESLHFCLVLCL